MRTIRTIRHHRPSSRRSGRDWAATSAQDADAARPDQEADDDQDDPVQQLTAHGDHDATDDEHDCEDPQDEFHAAHYPSAVGPHLIRLGRAATLDADRASLASGEEVQSDRSCGR